MLKNYFKIAFRNLRRNKLYSLIDILGFSFGISVCLLIVLFLVKEYSYDSYNTNADQIYKLIDTGNNSGEIDYRLASALVKNYPEVKNACVVNIIPKAAIAHNKKAYYIDGIMSTDNAFFQIFSTHFIYGHPASPLPNLNSVVLTESASQKMFGNNNPIGKEIMMRRLGGKYPLTVTGVINDFPDNSSIDANMIVNMENNNFKFSTLIGDIKNSSKNRYLFNIFLELSQKSNPIRLADKINSHPEITQSYVKKIGLLPLKNLYLHDNTTGSYTKKGNPTLMRLFAGIAIIVLLLVIINYINLSIAQQNKRNKETGIRKTLGADRKNIISLFLSESIFITFIAFAAALVIAEAALPFYSHIVDTPLSVHPLVAFPGILILSLFILVIGAVSGIVPALIFSSFSPARIISGKMFGPNRKNYFRNVLTIFQFTVSIALIFCTIVIQRQISFAQNINLGFNKEQLLRVDLPPMYQQKDISKADILTNKLRSYQTVRGVSVSNGIPGSIRMGVLMNKLKNIKSETNGIVSLIFADSSFISTFNIHLVKGRELLPGDYGQVCMINETAYKEFGWNSLNNKRFDYDSPIYGKKGGYKVIGVMKDFHTASIYQPIEPTCIIFASTIPPSSISLRIRKGAIGQTMFYLRKEWKQIFPDSPLNYRFYNEWFDQMYRKDKRLAYAIGLFAFLAISISCLGILGLATFSSERRAKEIGIRKVHGASVKQLIVLLNKDFLKWVAIAFIIACPVGWYAMNKWLQDFAYHVDIGLWMFVISGGIALLIALLTVSYQAIKAATANPVEALRYE